MIKVQKKFILNEQDKERLTKNADFLNERVFTDIYYDTEFFSLTSNDKWLRSREGRFELKLPLHEGVDRLADQYDELEDEQKIREALNLPSSGILQMIWQKLDIPHFVLVKPQEENIKKSHLSLILILLIFKILSTASERLS